MQGTKTGTSCDDAGKCQCKTENIVGDKCDSCKTNHYGFPNCKGTFFEILTDIEIIYSIIFPSP